MGARHIARPAAGGEAIRRVVCEGDRFGLVAEWESHEHRAEDLLLHNLAGLLRADDERWREVGTLSWDALRLRTAAHHDPRPCSNGAVNVASDSIAVRARDERAEICRRVERITDAHLRGELSNSGHEAVKDVALRVEARGCGAVLTSVDEGSSDRPSRGGLNVGVGKDNERRLTTKL